VVGNEARVLPNRVMGEPVDTGDRHRNHRHRSRDGCDHQIASVDMVREGGITNAIDTLVRPTKPIPPGASAVHHIVDADVANAPAFSEVIDRFKGADFYVAHNSEFERSFFAAQGIEFGPWICTCKCALRVWPDLEGHSNQELRYALGRATPFPGVRARLDFTAPRGL
jgi:DNA polymerase III epsilon subunit-like protein